MMLLTHTATGPPSKAAPLAAALGQSAPGGAETNIDAGVAPALDLAGTPQGARACRVLAIQGAARATNVSLPGTTVTSFSAASTRIARRIVIGDRIALSRARSF